MATIKDVAQLAGVSKATVSRVITGKTKVTPEVHLRVTEAMKRLQFKPNQTAQNLANRRSNAVGVLVGDFASPYYGQMLRGIEQTLQASGMHMIVTDARDEREQGKKSIEFLIGLNCDGLIICQHNMSEDHLKFWVHQGCSVAIINRNVPELPESSVYLDNELGGFIATDYLIQNGHRRIAHMSGFLSNQEGYDRWKGYRRALNHRGIDYEEGLVVSGDFSEEGGYAQMKQLLEFGPGFSAIFIANDRMAAGAMAAIYDAKLRIPEDISVVGFDDDFFASYSQPPLTTIHQPLFEMGQCGARVILWLLNKEGPPPYPLVFQPALVARQSVMKPQS